MRHFDRHSKLVAFSDGELSAKDAEEVQMLAAESTEVREAIADLDESLELALDVWHEAEKGMEHIRPMPDVSKARPVYRMLSRLITAAGVAAMLLFAVNRPADHCKAPVDNAMTVSIEQLMEQVAKEGRAARALARGDHLADQPYGEEFALEHYRLALSLADTQASRFAEQRIELLLGRR